MSLEMATTIELAQYMGDRMRKTFSRSDLQVDYRQDFVSITDSDLEISIDVVDFLGEFGRNVVCQRDRSAEYGNLDAEYLNPIDTTNDFWVGTNRLRPHSIAAFSLGSVMGGKFERGIANFPLLLRSHLYWGERDFGAYRLSDTTETRLHINTTHTEGAILVSENHHKYVDSLEKSGFQVVSLGGTAFNACAVVDSELIRMQAIVPIPEEPIIGFVSDSAQPHEYAAVAAIMQAAGGIASGIDGQNLRLDVGNHGCIFANNKLVQRALMDAAKTV